MSEIRKKIHIDCDLSFCSFYSALDEFNKEFNVLPNTLKVGLDNLNTAKNILKHIDPQDYKIIKDKIDLGFGFELDKNFEEYYWEVSKVVGDKKYILYSNGA